MPTVKLIPLSHSALSLYAEVCRPVCRELDIGQTAFDILMLLANHDTCRTAKDVARFSGIKKNLVSINVEKLVTQGYLERQAMPEDRRLVRLTPTEKAIAIVEKGHRVQKYYYDFLVKGLDDEELAVYHKCMETIARNVDELKALLDAGEQEEVI